MKQFLKVLTLGIFISFSFHQSNGQIFQSRSDIIKENGYSYESGTTDDGTKYIYYNKEFTSEQSGKYTQQKAIFFITLDNGTEICNAYRILEPSSEINTWVSYLKKNMVEIDYMKWKDYELGVLYKLEVEDEICIITAWYDF